MLVHPSYHVLRAASTQDKRNGTDCETTHAASLSIGRLSAHYALASLLALLIAASTPFFSLTAFTSARCRGVSCRM